MEIIIKISNDQSGGATHQVVTTPVAAQTTSAAPSTTPAIGDIWPGHGGIYCGMARGQDGEADYPLIMALEAPTTGFKWQAAQDHAKTITADGHSDFRVPTRFESALLYANVHDKIDTSNWHWTSTQSSEGLAFTQSFGSGGQDTLSKDYEFRARFVRRLVF